MNIYISKQSLFQIEDFQNSSCVRNSFPFFLCGTHNGLEEDLCESFVPYLSHEAHVSMNLRLSKCHLHVNAVGFEQMVALNLIVS